MAQFAPVAPIQILEGLKQDSILGTYHLLLAHHVLEEPERFAALFADQTNCTIILDNSIVELGDAENEKKVFEAYKILRGASSRNWVYPVLTDVMGDGPATREAAEASYHWWIETGEGADLMVVLQGNDFQDFCVTADKFLLDDRFAAIEYVGIPRILTKLAGSRQDAVLYLDAICPQTSVHLLGFSDNVADDLICSQHPSVEGIDSAVPIRYPGLWTPSDDAGPRDPDWFKNADYTAVREQITTNLYNVRKWAA